MKALPPYHQCAVAPHVAKECLSKAIIFKGCSPEFLSLLLELLELECFSVGEVVFLSGEVPSSMFIMKSGSCCIVNDCNAVIAEYSDPGDVFGEVSCFRSSPRAFTCVCSRFSEMYVLHVSGLAQLFSLFPDFQESFSSYCRRRILIDASSRLQLSALLPRMLHNEHLAAVLLSTACHSFSAQPPPATPSPVLNTDKRPPTPVQKGTYRPPISPKIPKPNSHDVISSQAIHPNEAQRIRAFAQLQVMPIVCRYISKYVVCAHVSLQMALSNYDFDALARKYDRVINSVNAGQGISRPISRRSAVVASMLNTVQKIVADSNLRFRFDLRLPSVDAGSESGTGHSIASHIVPGETSWQDDSNVTQIDEDDTLGSRQFFSVLARVLKKRKSKSQTTIFDNREGLKSIYS